MSMTFLKVLHLDSGLVKIKKIQKFYKSSKRNGNILFPYSIKKKSEIKGIKKNQKFS